MIIETPSGEVTATENAPDAMHAAHIAEEENHKRHEADLYRMDRMRGFAESLACRRACILRYFGEDAEIACGNCDVFLGKAAAAGETRREVTARRYAFSS